MTTLINDTPMELNRGVFVFKSTGALDIQMQIGTEGFTTITDGVLAGAEDGTMTIPDCEIQITNAGSQTLTISRTV